MKRNTPNHPKVEMLRSMLGLRKFQAVGLLECLWHHTAQFCPRGDIGKYTNEQLAAAVDWPRKNANGLIDALISCGLVELHDTLRLVIHDWHDHCDDACNKYLLRNGITYWNGKEARGAAVRTSRDKSGHVETSADKSGDVAKCPPTRAHVPEPEPEPDTEPESATQTTAFSRIKIEAKELAALSHEQWLAVMSKMGGHPRWEDVDWRAFATWVVREAAVFGTPDAPGPWMAKRLEQWLDKQFGGFRPDGRPEKSAKRPVDILNIRAAVSQ